MIPQGNGPSGAPIPGGKRGRDGIPKETAASRKSAAAAAAAGAFCDTVICHLRRLFVMLYSREYCYHDWLYYHHFCQYLSLTNHCCRFYHNTSYLYYLYCIVLLSYRRRSMERWGCYRSSSTIFRYVRLIITIKSKMFVVDQICRFVCNLIDHSIT